MKAVVLTAPRSLAVIDDLPEPDAGPGDVVVQLEGLGVCGSDLSVYEGHRAVPGTPWVVGHEAFGRIVATGSAVSGHVVGRRVVVEPNYACLECADCRRGLTSACPHRAIVGMNAPGLLAERFAVPAAFAHVVPEDLDVRDLAAFEPYVVARTAVERSGIGKGERALVLGAGAQGLLVSQSLLALGAEPVVIELHPERLARAVALGAGAATAADGGFLRLYETTGAAPALAAALPRLAPGATLTLIGLDTAPLPLTMDQVVRAQLTLQGSLIYDHPHDFRAALDDITSDRVHPSVALTSRYAFEEAPRAFAEARGQAGKTWIAGPR
ncbi:MULTISPECIES: alcohol dehydrogenase catalytic domain-containing protein [unclassified Streptomyces]|uniref:zinc-dependent alcohol dehydrogenase n=1 Tax=unclassified Streptomyces TaxID=2593676 RepID=UPI000DBAC4E6|nr:MULTISPECIES: alcohol dehydrogenase catalytic domain-containing protein [unclassified Streptomyces]MYT73112.1 alcohol dehydrogenase catalytic domain-containing protein [Streptomyces sp. SID8367]RAJ73573.1 alcohol dehydrogenase/L-iditol 2-dehydrogenase [Streptomyces sp. PsTaAH-137]